MRRVLWLVLVGLLSGTAAAVPEDEIVPTAPIVVDGVELFRVRGLGALPAGERAEAIAGRISEAAGDPSFDVSALAARPVEDGLEIASGRRAIMFVSQADAALDGVEPALLARAYAMRIRGAVEAHRRDRSLPVLARSAAVALVALVLLAAVLFVLRRAFRGVDAALKRRYGTRVHALRVKGFQVVDAQQVWASMRAGVRAIQLALVLVAVFGALYVALDGFPWTRPVSRGLLAYVMDPLRTMGNATLAYVPKLIFLIILVVVTRWSFKLLRLFFEGVDRGTIALGNFEPEWALPTFRLVRLLVLAFVLVVAYPYLPGSDSGAFKGVSLFLGVALSLGSTAALSNIIAGYSLTYRRAFRVGDVIRIGEHMGRVTEVRLLVTHLRTIKNEEIVVPNSSILNSNVVNYSTVARRDGLVLHTSVGIGYEVPWRQVEAMLLQAARRTMGLRTEPAPFVLQTALGDFAVTYQLNVYTDDPTTMALTYSNLHANVLDVFNEFGVQIMTPAYEGDPAEPKVVPKERWYASPAGHPERVG